MLHVCLSGISSIVAVMDGTGCFTCAFDPSIVAVMDGTGCFTCAFDPSIVAVMDGTG